MKSLEFEKISVAAVRHEIDGEHRQSVERKRAAQRAAQDQSVLLDVTSLWMAGLPAECRPIALARKFPRIANSIAELWRRVARCEEYLDTLVVDLRGDRSGFPPDVAQELTALRSYYAELHPPQGSILGSRRAGRIARHPSASQSVTRARRSIPSSTFCL